MFIRFDMIHEHDRQRRTDTAWRHIPRLCIASRGKNRHFYVLRPSFFCLPWGRPCGNHAKRCINEKTIQCLPNPSQYVVPIYLRQFPSYSNRNCKKSPFSRTAAHIVSPGDALAIITQYVAWMERQFNACQTPCSIYLSIFNNFRVRPIRCLSPGPNKSLKRKSSFSFKRGAEGVGCGEGMSPSQNVWTFYLEIALFGAFWRVFLNF